jgi:hypothetical protein
VVDHLPFRLGAIYRRWRRGTAAIFDMHFTSVETVSTLLRSAGIDEIHATPDDSAGAGTKGFLYICRKRTPA